jgi:hypothetical protein
MNNLSRGSSPIYNKQPKQNRPDGRLTGFIARLVPSLSTTRGKYSYAETRGNVFLRDDLRCIGLLFQDEFSVAAQHEKVYSYQTSIEVEWKLYSERIQCTYS